MNKKQLKILYWTGGDYGLNGAKCSTTNFSFVKEIEIGPDPSGYVFILHSDYVDAKTEKFSNHYDISIFTD